MIENETQRGWLAGILEGEGCFRMQDAGQSKTHNRRYQYPKVEVRTTDRDVLERIVAMMGTGAIKGPYTQKGRNSKNIFAWTVSGELAIELMLTIRDLMCERRRDKIDEILAEPVGRIT